MRLTFRTDDGQAVTLDVPPGENVWIEQSDPECNGNRIGSLYLNREADEIGLGRYSEEIAWWEYENPLPI